MIFALYVSCKHKITRMYYQLTFSFSILFPIFIQKMSQCVWIWIEFTQQTDEMQKQQKKIVRK